jgi:hypothetical protein
LEALFFLATHRSTYKLKDKPFYRVYFFNSFEKKLE